MFEITATMAWVISLAIGVGAAIVSYYVVRSEGESAIRSHIHKPHRLAH